MQGGNGKRMCGICGLSTISGRDSSPILKAMMSRIKHRGPDADGVYIDHAVAMGNTLLSIVDVGNGVQPFRRTWRDEEFICVYNGEVYNHLHLRKQLQAKDLRFATSCDTETILAAYAVWREDALLQFEGQWTVAIWEKRRQRLFLARDPLGIKPLYYWSNGREIAFASEPKALLVHPSIGADPCLDAVAEYLLHGFAFAAGYATSGRSFYEDIQQLEPGHYMIWEPGHHPRTVRYFTLPLVDVPSSTDTGAFVEELRNVITESVRISLLGDVPVGVALSGGLDSSIITAVASRELAKEGTSPLLAACISYQEQQENDDAKHASMLVASLGADAPVQLVFSSLSTSTYLKDLDRMIQHFDEPHWEPKQLAMFNNYRVLAANGVRVVLSGEGADELFFGYFHRFPGFLNPTVRSTAELRHLWLRRLPNVQRLLRGKTTSRRLRALIDEALSRYYTPYEQEGIPPERRMQAWYLHTFLHWLLMDNDRCSMAHSLEGRFPFLNKRVYELALRIPASLQVGNTYGEEKLLLRQAFAQKLPEGIRTRRKQPLPSPEVLGFHSTISRALQHEIEVVPSSIWDIVNVEGARAMSTAFREQIDSLTMAGKGGMGGRTLTSYLALNSPWQVRCPQAFGILTLLRWWRLNYN